MLVLVGLVLALGALPNGASTGRFLLELPLPSPLVSIEDPVGQQRLLEATYVSDFFLLAQHFVQQVNGAFCGPASSVMVLNALDVPRPQLQDIKAFEYYDQTNVFSASTETVVPEATVRKQGLSLPELAAFIAAHPGASTSFQHTTASVTLDHFRDDVLSALAQPQMFVIVNFDRALLQEVGGGHHSPIAAYHEATDSVLVLDVSRYKYPAWWVPISDLYHSTFGTVDNATKLPRGLAFVWSTPTSGPTTPRIGSKYITSGSDNDVPLPRASPESGAPSAGLPTGVVVGICIAVFALGGVLGWGASTMHHATMLARGRKAALDRGAAAGLVGIHVGGTSSSHEEMPLFNGSRQTP